MPADRIAQRIHDATHDGGKCLMPYVTAGFPDLATTQQLIARCDAAGCTAIEVGFPFSDSIADGPVIQESFYRALDAGFRVDALFEAIAGLRPKVSAGLIAMVSMSLVRRRGIERFVADAAAAGFDALIVPDVPVDESAPLAQVVESGGLCNVLMIAPTSSPQRRARIAAAARGFLYVISTRGITGERDHLAGEFTAYVQSLRALTRTPLIAGFGISTAAQARDACRVVDGVIVGSAIVRRITECLAAGQDVVAAIGAYVDELRSATRSAAA